MSKYRNKPVIVEAVQWFIDKPVDDVLFPAFHVTGVLPDDSYSMNHCGLLCTPDGDRIWKGRKWEPHNDDMRCDRYYVVEPGDWIVTDAKGHIGVYKNDVFVQMYDEITTLQQQANSHKNEAL